MIRWQRNLTRGCSRFVVGLGGPALAKSGNPEKLDKLLKNRAGKNGWSRVIVTLKPGADASRSQTSRRQAGTSTRAHQRTGDRASERSHPEAGGSSGRREPPLRPPDGRRNESCRGHRRRARRAGGIRGTGRCRRGRHRLRHDQLARRPDLPRLVVSCPGQERTAGGAFVDFVNGRTAPHDDNGHGTHVSGIIAGNGKDSFGTRAGIAPSAHLVSLKVLDDHGRGVISDVIAAPRLGRCEQGLI